MIKILLLKIKNIVIKKIKYVLISIGSLILLSIIIIILNYIAPNKSNKILDILDDTPYTQELLQNINFIAKSKDLVILGQQLKLAKKVWDEGKPDLSLYITIEAVKKHTKEGILQTIILSYLERLDKELEQLLRIM